MAVFQILLLFWPILLVLAEESKPCLQEKDYASCHIGSSCNLYDANPCGCKHACCAPDHFRGKHNHALPFLYGYRCYKKLTCGQACGRYSRCGCANGLVCIKDEETKIKRCSKPS